jgi:hypothetical protein
VIELTPSRRALIKIKTMKWINKILLYFRKNYDFEVEIGEYRILQKIKDNPTQAIYQAQKLIIRGWFRKKSYWIPLTDKWWSTPHAAELEINKNKKSCKI